MNYVFSAYRSVDFDEIPVREEITSLPDRTNRPVLHVLLICVYWADVADWNL